ncbi:uncharacterized protein N0V89_005628 [Didymosphaeria variabile]|uniref:Bacteriophage T5 Orf172 DNA-binding domain-containing protein n=1 Tax=Didymosphaeria variabile TaxID=1932322 RepID=A0A9W8XN89_9PLEO|nr:uncharacterized protein N0V89_005628 [Didymosphaeria variabile]KAJ4353898.1 hypothetical protein N0V89_005628 [Didymosphaeria variabile]
MALFSGRTPESLIPRSDSRNPATTCKGITKSGRPCRRAIDAKDSSRNNGVLAVASVISDDDDEETGAAAFFCWQHKDQAEHLVAADATGPGAQDTQLYPLQERNSIDTLVARLVVLDLVESAPAPERRRRQSRPEGPASRPPRRINRPPTWEQVQGPLMSVPSDVMAERRRRAGQRLEARPQPKKQGFWASLCCGAADEDYVEVVRHKRRTQEQPVALPMTEAPRPQGPPRTYQGRPSNTSIPSSAPRPATDNVPERKPLGDKPARPINKTSRPSETSKLLSYIPKSVSPQTTSTLLTELSKPISDHDEEGYIYIFWLTPETMGPAPSSTASSLLAPPTRPEQGRRTSDVLRQYSVRRPQRPRPDAVRQRPGETSANDTEEKNTILLKIGRANNVTRRMHEWTRQCGYSLSLVRYYPYVPSTPSPSPQASPAGSRRPSYINQRPSDPSRRVSEGVRKVPHAHRVERLIHIELASQRVMKKCDACGKDHREWFEVEATKEGVKGVDEVVKRWVEWAEKKDDR